jgi:predicted metal-dependent peptidase
MSTKQLEEKLTKARVQLLLNQPFYGILASRLGTEIIESTSTDAEVRKHETAMTDGKRIIWYAHFLESLTGGETQAVLAHEIEHCARGHVWRMGARELDRWNIAADKIINNDLRDACGLTLPADCYYADANEVGKSTEEVYKMLPDSPPSGSGGGSKPGNDPGRCGSVIRPAPGTDMEAAQAEMQVQVIEAAKAAQAIGKCPSHIAAIVASIVNPKIPWTRELYDFVERTARNDYNWNRPNKRHIGRGFVLPTLINDELPSVVVIADESGSISKAEHDQFAAETSEVLGAYDTTVTVLHVDTAVDKVEEFTRADLPFVLKRYKNGSTDLRKGFDWIEQNELQPSCVIVLTDMMTPFPAQEPEYPVLWVSTSGDRIKPPFGRLVELN